MTRAEGEGTMLSHNLPTKLALGSCRHLVRAVTLASALSSLVLVATQTEPATSSVTERAEPACVADYEPSGTFPRLPEAAGADLSGEPGVLIHLEQHRSVVELDDCLYEVDRPLVIDFADLELMSLLLELPETASASTLFLSSPAGVEVHVVEDGIATFSMSPDTSLGFELAAPGQSAPTVPIIIAKPVDDDPPPS